VTDQQSVIVSKELELHSGNVIKVSAAYYATVSQIIGTHSAAVD
jgi:hypothetical protein